MPRPPAQPADATDRTVVVGRVAAEGLLDLPPGTRISLAVLDGPDKGKQFRITKARTVIGRREGEVRLTDPEVSGRHAVLTVHPGGCTIEDLQSTNGTFVNGARASSAPLSH
ncbi:MAG: FHA domain-containing protein, partial [Candidatus Methylomirabilales bacterium]